MSSHQSGGQLTFAEVTTTTVTFMLIVVVGLRETFLMCLERYKAGSLRVGQRAFCLAAAVAVVAGVGVVAAAVIRCY